MRGASVLKTYDALCAAFGNAWNVLANTPIEEIENVVEKNVAVAISKNRAGDVEISPGYDGEYGKVTIALPGLKKGRPKRNKTAGVPAQSRLL